MKRWAVVVAILYGLMLGVLWLPGYLLAFAPNANFSRAVGMVIHWQAWLFLAVMVLAQIAMLAVPVRLASRRPLSRRPLILTLVAAALMMSALVFGAFCSIYEFGFHEQGGAWTLRTAFGLGVGAWCVWAAIFYRFSRTLEAGDLLSRLCKWMLGGSVLELLIAVPTHIVARCRDYCCAGVMTFIGLTLGISVMLFSFGPGVFFLFVARWRRLHPQGGRAATWPR